MYICYVKNDEMSEQLEYNEDNIRSLDWKEHMRLRPGMYIGKTGDGSSQDDRTRVDARNHSV